MSIIAYYCECIGNHDPKCALLKRLRIKEQVCREYGIISYIPEEVAQEIDRRVEAAR